MKTAVIAGDKEQFDWFIREYRADRKQYVYITHERNLMGVTIRDLLLVGTWFRRANIDYLIDLAKARIRSVT